MTECPTPDKRRYTERAHAKQVEKQYKGSGSRAYLCDCGFYHLGRNHGRESRAEHRIMHRSNTNHLDRDYSSVTWAAQQLEATEDTVLRLIDANRIRHRTTPDGATLVHREDTIRLKELTWRQP